MSLSMEFFAGLPSEIGRAFTAAEFTGLRNGTLAHSSADLSLKVSREDLDVLSREIAESLGHQPVLLLNSLESHVGGTEGKSSADVVSTTWVEAVAATPYSSIALLAEKWMAAVGSEMSHDALSAVEALVKLCRDATLRNTRVVFAWSLEAAP